MPQKTFQTQMDGTVASVCESVRKPPETNGSDDILAEEDGITPCWRQILNGLSIQFEEMPWANVLCCNRVYNEYIPHGVHQSQRKTLLAFKEKCGTPRSGTTYNVADKPTASLPEYHQSQKLSRNGTRTWNCGHRWRQATKSSGIHHRWLDNSRKVSCPHYLLQLTLWFDMDNHNNGCTRFCLYVQQSPWRCTILLVQSCSLILLERIFWKFLGASSTSHKHWKSNNHRYWEVLHGTNQSFTVAVHRRLTKTEPQIYCTRWTLWMCCHCQTTQNFL